MRTSFTRFAAVVAALVALAIGGSALALASGGSHPKGQAAARPHATRLHAVARTHARATDSRKSSEDPGASEQQGENESSSDPDSDAAAQASACQKAGIDPNADNVQYDDQTGSCSRDTGGSTGA